MLLKKDGSAAYFLTKKTIKMKKQIITAVSILLISTLGAQAQIITTVAGNTTMGYSGDGGVATAAKLSYTAKIAVDGSGNLYIADETNAVIRKVNASGIITTVAGNNTAGYSGDGFAATAAKLSSSLQDVAVDGSGNLYIADAGNNRIRKVTAAGIITTVAGNGLSGFSGDGAAAISAQLATPYGVKVDGSGNLYIADAGNNRVRKVSASGIITTVAGSAVSGFSGDGGAATAATLDGPVGLAIDGAGNLYIADNNNHSIRKVSVSGIITTLVGNGTSGYSGDGGNATAAQLKNPIGVVVDASGNLFIGDQGNNRVRKVTAGVITTFAGNGVSGYSGDGGAATLAQLNQPGGVAVGSGSLYIADHGNHIVRKVHYDFTGVNSFNTGDACIKVYPNPIKERFTVNIYSKNEAHAELTITNILGQKVKEIVVDTNTPTDIFLDAPAGVFFLLIQMEHERWCEKIVK